jgi:hypothetical protein
MEQAKFSTIAHRDHTFFSPLNSERVNQILALLELLPGTIEPGIFPLH